MTEQEKEHKTILERLKKTFKWMAADRQPTDVGQAGKSNLPRDFYTTHSKNE